MKVICFLLVFLFANELLSQDVFVDLDSVKLYESDTKYKKPMLVVLKSMDL